MLVAWYIKLVKCTFSLLIITRDLGMSETEKKQLTSNQLKSYPLGWRSTFLNLLQSCIPMYIRTLGHSVCYTMLARTFALRYSTFRYVWESLSINKMQVYLYPQWCTRRAQKQCEEYLGVKVAYRAKGMGWLGITSKAVKKSDTSHCLPDFKLIS